MWIIYGLLLTFVSASELSSKAEKYYKKKQYDKLKEVLNKIHESDPVLNRLKGHLCLFGQNKNENIDLDCAWKSYAAAAKRNDAESYFYLGFMLNNFLFSDLQLVKNSFPDFDISSAKSTDELIALVEAKAESFFKIAADQKFILATIKLGDIEPTCSGAMKYYVEAADILFADQDLILYPEKINKQRILRKSKPYREKYEEMDPEYALQILNNLSSLASNNRVFLNVGINLYRVGRYEEAIKIFKKLLSHDIDSPLANYFMGLMYYYGQGVEQDIKQAINYFKHNHKKFRESMNAIGVIIENYNVSVGNITAEDWFELAANNGSAYGNYNAFRSLVKKDGLFNERALTYLINAAAAGHPKAQYIYGVLLVSTESTCGGLYYSKKAVEYQIWDNYFGDIYQHIVVKQEKVATMYYMVLGEIGCSSAQVTAANLLDDNNFFWSNSYIKTLNSNWNLDKYLAFRYYKKAEINDETLIFKRLADFYYYGLIPEKNYTGYLYYIQRAFEAQESYSIMAQISFDMGVICQFSLIPELDCSEDAEFYYASATKLDRSGYLPGTIMLKLTQWYKNGIKISANWILYSIPFIILTIWLFITFILIYKRQL